MVRDRKAKGSHLWVAIETVSEITGVEVSTLLEWERQFKPYLNPEISGSQRRYAKADVDAVMRIKGLMRDAGYTVDGTKRALMWSRKRAA